MIKTTRQTLAVCLMLAGWPAGATTYSATSATLKSVFAKIKAGDTIKLTGTFNGATLQARTFSSLVTIDARSATFTNTLKLYNLGNVKVLGGHYGSTTSAVLGIRVQNSSKVYLSSPVVVGNGTSAHGIDFSSSNYVSVTSGNFTGLRAGVTFSAVSYGTLTNNKSVRASSDGFDISDSHNVTITGNSCSGTVASPGAHPDCVQLWSIKGHAPQSDITITGNTATGPTQGFTSFNGSDGGGIRFNISNNRVDTSFPQGIACYECVDSKITGNVVTTQAGAQWRTSINIVGGHGNTVANNSVGDKQAATTTPAVMMLADDAATSAFTKGDVQIARPHDRSFTEAPPLDGDFAPPSRDAASPFGSEVPEPGTWALLIAGFGLVGAVARQRRRPIVAA